MYFTTTFYHPTFNRSEVIVLTNKLTNKQRPLKTSTSLRYATPVGKEWKQAVQDGEDLLNRWVFVSPLSLFCCVLFYSIL